MIKRMPCPPRTYLALCLLIPLALLAASCGSDSDSSTSQDSSADSDTTAPVSVTGLPPARAEATTTTALARTTTPTEAETSAAPTTTLTPTTTAPATTTEAPTTTQPTTTAPATTTEAPTTTPPTTAAPTTAPPSTTTTTTTLPASRATAIVPGGGFSCALNQTGTISCWGVNSSGQLGNGRSYEDYSRLSQEPQELVPAQVTGITDATAITTGGSYSCTLHQNGTISCWGNNEYGQLGNGTPDDSAVPVRVLGITDAKAVTTGSSHSCALHQDGAMSCWGFNLFGELGNGRSYEDYSRLSQEPQELVPVQVTGITDVTAITTGGSHSCALHQDGTISCWGNNTYGQLGNGTSGDDAHSSIPVRVTSITDATAITTGSEYSCALHRDGTISCWGSNWVGQLGNGQSGDYWGDDSANSSVPVRVMGITDVTAITTGGSHSCALHQDGTISCWGNNTYGQLGNGTSGGDAYSSIPVQVTGITDATAINAGGDNSCAFHQTGTISCWGDNTYGQLGDGNSGYIEGNDLINIFSSVPMLLRGFGS